MKNRTDYFREYNKKNNTRVSLNLSKEKDQDIIQAIETAGNGNKQSGVKILIRQAINNEA